MTRPTFLVVGAAKSGTTSLCHLLRQHPEIFMSSRKEIQYFSFDPTYARGREWYESWFAGAEGFRQAGEGSATYTLHEVFPHAARRIAEYEPGMRLIYIARHPLERMESLWMQLRTWGASSPFRDLRLTEVPLELRVDADFNRALRRQVTALVDSTNYWREIGVYRRHFPDDQILVLLFEEFVREPRAVLRRCFEFLGVDADPGLAESTAHLNAMSRHCVPPDFLLWLWSSPRRRRLYSAAGELVPRRVRAWIRRRWLRVPVTERPRWDPATRAWVWRRLEPDLVRFLEFYGYPADSWRLSPDPLSRPAGREP